MKNNIEFVLIGIIILSLSFLISCSKKDDKAFSDFLIWGFDGPEVSYDNAISFKPDETPINNSIYLYNSYGTTHIHHGGGVSIEVRAKRVEHVSNIKLEIFYDTSTSYYGMSAEKYIEGDFLKQDGGITTFSTTVKDKRKISIEINRENDTVGVSGDGLLATINFGFYSQNSGTFFMGFNTTNCVLKSPTENISNTQWIGGTFDFRAWKEIQ
ncbi:MAG: hypothetical protein PHX78_10815 [bacterium]|nr:hypothetical protein [bacterium]